MKKQIIWVSCAMLLLSACPQNGNKIQKPDGAPPAAVQSFPTEQLPCCWDDLQQKQAEYQDLALKAYNGDEAALKSLLELSDKVGLMNGYGHGAVLAVILMHLGDQRFAYTLQSIALDSQHTVNTGTEEHPETLRVTLLNVIDSGFSLLSATGNDLQNLGQYPLSAEILKYELASPQ